MNSSTKITSIVCLAMILIGCSTEPSPQISLYGIINDQNIHKITRINLGEYDSFSEVLMRIQEVACADSIPTISILNKMEERLIGLANPCMEGVACILIKTRNILSIRDEILWHPDPIDLDSLNLHIYMHYENNGESFAYSESPEDAIISISYKEKSITGITKLLNNIIESHSSLSSKAPLKIKFDSYIPPPPPPPPPMKNYE